MNFAKLVCCDCYLPSETPAVAEPYIAAAASVVAVVPQCLPLVPTTLTHKRNVRHVLADAAVQQGEPLLLAAAAAVSKMLMMLR